MKKLIALLLLSVPVYAEEIPDYMKDGTIVVTLKDGRSYSFSTNEYKVVKRGQAAAPKVEAKVEEAKEENRNRIRFMGGSGPNGFDRTKEGNTVTVTTRNEPIVGAGYERKVNDDVFIGGEVLSNGTYLLTIGSDF